MARPDHFSINTDDYRYATRNLSPSARGLWVDCLCYMWNNKKKGELIATPEQLPRLFGESENEVINLLNEIADEGLIKIIREGIRLIIINTWIHSRFDSTRRPSIPQHIRRLVLSVGACSKCGSTENLSVDHIYPWSKGGAHNINNFQCLCLGCNLKKGAKLTPTNRRRA